MHNYLACLGFSYGYIYQQLKKLSRFSERRFAKNNPVDAQAYIVIQLGHCPYYLGNKRIAFKYQRIRLPLYYSQFELDQP
jgi:hypothetical protein